MFITLLIMTILSIPLRADSTICSFCECLQSSVVECDDMELTQIPDLHGDDIHRLSFIGNSIKRISKLPRLASLRKLSFRFNTITFIEESAFSDLPHLIYLDLSYNNLTVDSLGENTFKGPPHKILDDPLVHLKSLNLSYNDLDRLTEEMFRHLENISVLSLRNNPLEDLSAGSVVAFSSLPNLEKLDLAYTDLLRLPSHVFADLRKLKYLDLSGNQFGNVPTEINFVPSLRQLILNDLLWTSITPGSFYESLENLETLHISYAPLLASIDNYAFANLTSLSTLIITHNRHLLTLQEHCFSSKLNKTLTLEEVRLTHNNLRTLPLFAIEWSTIELLDLQHNPWQCDCNFEWIAKGLIPQIQEKNKEITLYIVCAFPKYLMGKSVVSKDVQNTEFICYPFIPSAGGSFIILLLIFIGVLLFAAGTVFFSYALFKRTQSRDWMGSHIQYRKVKEPVTISP